MTVSVTAIVLTHNEQLHIERCIASLKSRVERIVVVDSGSTDLTVEIARQCGAEVYAHPFRNYATQFNWALESCAISTDWVMRIDADEYVDAELGGQVCAQLPAASQQISGFVVERRVKFLGKVIRFGGGVSPQFVLKIWRRNKGAVENRWMDEHTVLFEGGTSKLAGLLIDDNLKGIGFWIDKHNRYAAREMIDAVNSEFNLFEEASSAILSAQAKVKRVAKTSIYARLPLLYRAFCYFFYRYLIRLGFLDGTAGLIFHLMQGLWYRLLVDLRILEAREFIRCNGTQAFKKMMEERHSIKI
ncbi:MULTISPECIES: glycosyltransferase family 2 protein [unclassified Bradyrhizobium]|uniref:glycosyltransferase family 2 protein n=1 Tax=unclassified Bradyrhizobium TaxID=2631580 RepID=UPI001FF9B986|nr:MULTISPECIES: glycosyltransferase family 2 protein [unclassified Bradyrhizobium]MCK1345784.1 glycosyltransferase family 2 protein [Bradyrhizobium sp. CW11]MCK1587116.1 glycosyltransferase family 2 protein [Bradyrhizobium sp. 169]